MRHYFILLVFLLTVMSAKAHAEVNIFACEPEWAALTKEIGAENVSVFSATKGTQDPHHVNAKPSLLAGIRKADLVICTGSGLEAGWLPVLLQSAPAKVQAGQIGNLMVTEYVQLMGKPASVDRAMGDIHPEGNPHIQTDPHNISTIAEILAKRLVQIDPANAKEYQSRYSDFNSQWRGLISKWDKEAVQLEGTKVVTYHESWVYLLKWLGIEQVATLEIKPGIPPTASHLDNVLHAATTSGAKLILLSPFDNDQAAKWLAEKTGARIIRLPFTVGGTLEATTLEALFDQTIQLLTGQK